MYKKPEHFEEAKLIITECEENKKFMGKYYKAVSLKAAFVTAVGVMCSYAAGLISGMPEITQDLLPLAGGVGVAFWFPIIGLIKTHSRVMDGSIFEKRPPSEIMRVANKYVEEYNKFEAEQEAKKKEKEENGRSL